MFHVKHRKRLQDTARSRMLGRLLGCTDPYSANLQPFLMRHIRDTAGHAGYLTACPALGGWFVLPLPPK
jgi:hypothetical protein